jgi:hypothetical protein
MADHFAFHHEHLCSRPTLNILNHCATVPLHFGNKASLIIHDGFPQHSYIKREQNECLRERILQLVSLLIAVHILTHSVQTRTNTRWSGM